MKIRNRKLFPTLSSTNQTTKCPDICDPTCPYNNCPDFYFLPPPPPLPASPPPAPSPPLHAAHHNKRIHVSPSLAITLSSAAALIVVLVYVIVTKSSVFRRSRNNTEAAPSDDSSEDFLDENRVDHPIWFIATIGLQQSIINSIAICRYKKSEGLIEGTECSVCLNEFQDGETVRLLPKCSHAFHITCIDTWLRSHTNCPLCRANIVSDSGNSNASRSPPMPQGEVTDQQDHNSNLHEDLQRRDLGVNGEMGSAQNVDLVLPRSDADEIQEDDIERVSKEGLGQPHESIEMKIIGESGNNHEAMEEEVKPISNLVSIDFSSASTSGTCSFLAHSHLDHASKDMEDQKAEDGREVVFEKTNCSSVQEFRNENPVLVTRSHSCSGGYFLSRHSRSTTPILPY